MVSKRNNARVTSKVSHIFVNIFIVIISCILIFLLYEVYTRISPPSTIALRNNDNSELLGDVVQVEVLNGCGEKGIATRFTSRLQRLGYDVINTGNYERFDVQKTHLILRTGDIKNAQNMAKMMNLGEDRIIIQMASDFYLDISVVIGLDYEELSF